MKKIFKKVLFVLSMIAISIPIGISVYNYGTPISYELVAITNLGNEIKLPNSWVHMAWTPQYLMANGFHNFVNAVSIVVFEIYNIMVVFSGVITTFSVLSGFAYLVIRKLRTTNPSNLINGGPYKLLRF